jgi:alanine racemase
VTCGARAFIRLDALEHNFRRIRSVANGARVLAVVKANAYGHGLSAVARKLAEADGFAVARYDEAVELFELGLKKPVVILEGFADAAELGGALERSLQPVVHCEQQIRLLESAAPANATVWLKLDTGMHRLGFRPEHSSTLVARLNACKSVSEVRLMTHLASADVRSSDTTARQLDAFRKAVEAFDGDISVANSPGIFGWPGAIWAGVDPARSWVRPGICLYGISPFPDSCGRDLGLRAVMEFETTLIAVKAIRKGDRVGYGGTWEAPEDTVLGIVAAGYGDGYTRFLPSGTPVLVDGRRATLAGTVSMDMAAVDLGPAATAQPGTPVTLWGGELPVEEVAAHAGTIAYQLVCGVTSRPRRITRD